MKKYIIPTTEVFVVIADELLQAASQNATISGSQSNESALARRGWFDDEED